MGDGAQLARLLRTEDGGRHRGHAQLVAHDVPARLNGQKRGELGGFGGGALERPRRWMGSWWQGLALGVPSRPEPPGAPRGGAGVELWHCQVARAAL